MKTTTNLSKRIFGFVGLLLLTTLACRLSAYQAAPPTAQFIYPNDANHEFFVNEPLEITFFAEGENEIPYVEVNLGSADGQLIASYGNPEEAGKTRLRETITWVPPETGRYALYLTAFDNLGRASEPARVVVQIYPKPVIVASGSGEFKDGNSFDFVSEVVGEYEGGDLLFYRNGPADFNIVANYPPQAGGSRIYASPNTNNIREMLYHKSVVREIMSPDRDTKMTINAIPVEEYGLYLYKRHAPPGDYILFMITRVEDDRVWLDYVVFDLP